MMAEKSKQETIFEIRKLAKAICARAGHPILIVSNGERQYRSAPTVSEEPAEDVW